MFKRSNANYSLWPEQARPRRGMPFALAAGGFAVGIVCAIAVVNVASQYIRPMAMEPEPVQNAEAVAPIPVYSGSSSLVAGKPASEDQSAAHNRPRTVAKVALPTIGRAVPVASETDGRGDNSAVKMPPVRLTDNAGAPAAVADTNAKLIRSGDVKTAAPAEQPNAPQETKLAVHEPAPDASADPTQPEPAATPQHEARPEPQVRVKSHSQRRVERNRQQPSRWDQRHTREERQYYSNNYGRSDSVARFREAPIYGSHGAPINSYLPY